jgi:hypothetical protein
VLNAIMPKVILIEKGLLPSSRSKAVNILRCLAIGGSTTVNWITSFRTPHSGKPLPTPVAVT